MNPHQKPQGDVVGLLPCPLCGAQPRRNGRMGAGGVLCAGDNKTVGMIHRFQTYGADQAEADTAWNTRSTPTYEAGRRDMREGWALVPREPTDEMRDAGWIATRHIKPFCERAVSEAAWEAMLDALPTEPLGGEG